MTQSVRFALAAMVGACLLPRAALAESTLVEAEDTDRVQYTGSWATRTHDTDDPEHNIPFSKFPQVHGGKIRRSQKPGDRAVLKFRGRSVSVIFLTSMAGGIVRATIDGADRGSLSLYNNAYQSPPTWQMYFGACSREVIIANDLPDGPHTLELTVTKGKPFNWSACGTRVDIDAFRYGDFPFATIRGTVSDPDGDAVHREVDWRRKNIPPAKVVLRKGPETRIVYLSDDGTYALSGLAEGSYDVTVSAPGFRTAARRAVKIAPGNPAEADFRLAVGPGHPLNNRIHAPRLGTPVLTRPGDTFPLAVNADPDAAGWRVRLHTRYNAYPLGVVQATRDDVAGWTLKVKVPANVPPELYDLAAEWTGPGKQSDTSIRAVKVYEQYQTEFYFVHHTDPQGGWDQLRQVAAEVNLINPEFVITTGDNLPGPWRPGIKEWDWRKWHQFLPAFNTHRVATFSAPGNHCVGPGTTLMPTYYKQFIGRRAWSQRYGDYHILTLDNCIFNLCNAYKFDRGGYYDAREKWVIDRLKANRDATLTFLGIHVGMDNFSDLPGNSWYAAMKASGRRNGCWIDDYGVDMVLHGHWGKDSVRTRGPGKTLFVETRDITKKGRAYRLIRIKGGKIVSYTYDGDPKRSLTAGGLSVAYARPNDGAAVGNTATIANNHNQHFEQGLVRFVMKKGRYAVSATPGRATIGRAVDSDDGRFTVCTVHYNIPARSKSTVTLTKAP